MNNAVEKVLALLDDFRTNDEMTYSAYSVLYDEISLLDDMLKEHEPAEPIAIKQERVDEFYGFVSCCPKCDCVWIMGDESNMHFCPECGRAVKWSLI